MSPKLQMYAAVGEIISAIAVVVSILFLAYEIRENTALMRTTAAAQTRDSLASSSDIVLGFNDSMLELITRTREMNASLADLSDIDQIRISSWQRSFFRRAEAQYFRYRAELLDEEVWATVRSRVIVNLQNPLWKEIWDRDRNSVYTSAFVAEIETHIQ